MNLVMIQADDREQLILDFCEAIRTGPDRPFVVVLSYRLPPEQREAVTRFVEALPKPADEP